MQNLKYWIATGLALLVVAFGLGRFSGQGSSHNPPILTQVQSLSDLVTVKYVMSHVVTHEIEGLFGKDKVLLVAYGVVKAGIDLGKLTEKDIRIDEKTRTISFHLSPSAVTDRYLDEKRTNVYDRRTDTFKPVEKDLETEARRIALGAILSAAHANGIHKDADARARELIEGLAKAMGYSNVEFH